MLVVENLTQPIGQASVFSINNFCDDRRLDIRLASSDLLGIFNSGGDGTLVRRRLSKEFPALKRGEAWRMQSQSTEEFQLQFGEPVVKLYRQVGPHLVAHKDIV